MVDCALLAEDNRTGQKIESSFLYIIAGILSYKLSPFQYRKGKPSVYINSGHGSYGVTLGMGTGKIMSQMILGDEPDVNVSKLGIPSDAFRISAYQEPGKVQQWDLFDRSFPMRQSGQPNEKL